MIWFLTALVYLTMGAAWAFIENEFYDMTPIERSKREQVFDAMRTVLSWPVDVLDILWPERSGDDATND